jgi:hypothetical protein
MRQNLNEVTSQKRSNEILANNKSVVNPDDLVRTAEAKLI